MTSTTFDHPFMHRKLSQKQAPQGEGAKESEGADNIQDPQNELAKQNGSSSEVKSDPETENAPKQPRGSKIAKHSSFSFGHLHHTSTGSVGKEPRLLKPGASKGAEAKEAESTTPTMQGKPKSLAGLKKLQTLMTPKTKETKESPSPSASSGDAPEESTTNEDNEVAQRPPSRLKFPGGGRSTPSSGARSLQRPSSRLNKTGSNSANNLLSEGAGGADEGEGPSKEKQLRLQRKGSDGVLKRHQVAPMGKSPSIPDHVIQSGTSSLPRHMPKGMVTAKHVESAGSRRDELSSSGEKTGLPSNMPREKTGLPSKVSAGKSEGFSSGLRKPGEGAKKQGLALGVRTPNLPSSSGPQSSTTSNEGEERVTHSVGAGGDHAHSVGSPNMGKKLMQPKALGGQGRPSLESRLKRATSPSAKQKLHRITPSTGPPPAKPLEAGVGVARPLPQVVKTAEEHSSSSSLESEVQPARQPSMVVAGETAGGLGDQHKKKQLGKSEDTPVVKSDSEGVESEMKPSDVSDAESVKQEVSLPNLGPLKEVGVAKDSHLQYGRRISPEGMSHEEISSPKAESSKDRTTPPQSPSHAESCHTPIEDSSSSLATSTEKEEQTPPPGGEEGEERQSRYHGGEQLSNVQRARSLSPKSPYRLMPKGMSRVRDLEGGVGSLTRTTSSDSTSSEGCGTPSLSRKPLKSSLRQKKSGSKSRHSSSSSMEGSASTLRQVKVTISPRSSQVWVACCTSCHGKF